VESFVATTCPRCGGPARRETDVGDTFFDSAWYYLRYPSTDFDDRPWDDGRTALWLPVDLYAAGREHVARHHLYARFLTRALHDLGLVPFKEPFPRLRIHGEIATSGGEGPTRKMSKSQGNVVNPDEYIDRVGADNLRLYLLFSGDWLQGGEFDDAGLMGIVRFTRRLWRLLNEERQPGPGIENLAALDRATLRVGRDLERFKFNTAVAALMELSRWLAENEPAMSAEQWARAARTFALLLAPLAPFLAEELWHLQGGGGSVHTQRWPEADPAATVDVDVTLAVQVNGRFRARRRVPAGLDQEEAVREALAEPAVQRALGGREPARAVYVPDRLLNLLA
jgi:leucyl-tRNA synthetase